MNGFRRKLHLYVGSRPAAAVARAIGIGQSTLQRWLEGQSPTLSGLEGLAAGTGLPMAYWADDSVPELASPASLAPVATMVARATGSLREVAPQAADPRALEVHDDLMSPLLERGQVAVYDAAPDAELREGALVAVRLGGKLVVRRRQLSPQGVVYTSPNPAVAPTILRAGETLEEHPVVAIILRPRAAGEAQAEPGSPPEEPPGDGISERDAAYMVAEEEVPYGERRPRRRKA